MLVNPLEGPLFQFVDSKEGYDVHDAERDDAYAYGINHYRCGDIERVNDGIQADDGRNDAENKENGPGLRSGA